MTEDKKYNGWTNYETGLCNLWFDGFWSGDAQDAYDNAEPDNHFTRKERATLDLADQIQAQINEFSEEQIRPEASFWNDILNAALSEINYYEIAEAYMSEIDTSEESEEDIEKVSS